MSLRSDRIATEVVRKSYQDIQNLVNTNEIVPSLYAMKRITQSQMEQLLCIHLTDQQKGLRLYSFALLGKGQQGLDAFLKALDETAYLYAPHTELADKLRCRLKEHERDYDSPGPDRVLNLASKGSTSSASEQNSSVSPTREDMNSRHPQCASNVDSGYGTDSANSVTQLEKFDHPLIDMIPLKMMILGNVRVGKTALMYRFKHGVYSDCLPKTVGGDRTHCYLCHKAKYVNIKLSVWDAAGDESIKSITPSFYNNVDVVVMVFDMTDNELMKSLRAVEEDWYTQLHRSQVNVPIILAGNKCESAGVNKRIVKFAEHMVTELAGFHSFMEVSAMSNFAVDELFERAVTLGLGFHTPNQENRESLEASRN